MTGPAEEVAAQLRDELGAAAYRVAVLAGPGPAVEWETTIVGRCDGLALTLVHGDPDEVAETVIDVMNALWPTEPPEACRRASWWRTPLGRCCARSLAGIDGDVPVTHETAARMLGVARGTVPAMVARGTLDRHPSRSVSRASVLRRIATRDQRDRDR